MNVFKLIGGLCLAVPAVALLLAGPRKTVDAPAGVTVIEYWEKWTGHEGDALAARVRDFNQTRGREKGIYVKLLSTSGILQKTTIATAGGTPPDVAGLWEQAIPQMAALGALTPLDELARAYNAASPAAKIEPSLYKKVFWDMCRYDGRLYSLVSTPYCYALYYNTKIFRENADKLRAAGLDPTKPPATIDELDRYAKALDVVDAGGNVVRTGYLPLEPGWDLSYWPYNFGGFWWDKAARRFTYTSKPVIDCYTWVQSYSERLGEDAVSNFRSALGNYDSPQNAFLSGTTAIVSQGTFFANIIRTQRPSMDDDWAAAPLPTAVPGLTGVTSATADMLVIPHGAKHPKEAFEFIAWLQEQKNMEALCDAHCKISPLAAVSDGFLEHHGNKFIKVFETLAAGPNARPSPQIETMTQVAAEMTIFTQDLAALRIKDPARALADMQATLQKKQDDFMAKQTLWKK